MGKFQGTRRHLGRPLGAMVPGPLSTKAPAESWASIIWTDSSPRVSASGAKAAILDQSQHVAEVPTSEAMRTGEHWRDADLVCQPDHSKRAGMRRPIAAI